MPVLDWAPINANANSALVTCPDFIPLWVMDAAEISDLEVLV